MLGSLAGKIGVVPLFCFLGIFKHKKQQGKCIARWSWFWNSKCQRSSQSEGLLIPATGKAVSLDKLICGDLEVEEKNFMVTELKGSQWLMREVIGLIQWIIDNIKRLHLLRVFVMRKTGFSAYIATTPVIKRSFLALELNIELR